MKLRALAPFALGSGLVAASLLAFLASPSERPGRSKAVLGALHMSLAAHAAELPAEPAPKAEPAVVAAKPAEPADRHLDRSWRAPLAGGLLTFPPSFHSEDGRYDLVLHLNGNTDLVEESYGYAGVNAVVVILNLGVGSGVYETRFEDPSAFSLILERVQTTLLERGLKNARLGRIAVSGWSSGYGGVIKLLQYHFDRIDAVVLLDSIHCGYHNPYTKELKADQIEPTRRFAKKAALGKALLSITHSEIVTYGYLNAHDATDKVLEAVGLSRSPSSTWQPMPRLATMVGVLPKAQMVPLPPLTEVHKGGLHVRGYTGHMPVTHMLHLVQMSTTALPDLVEHWKQPAAK